MPEIVFKGKEYVYNHHLTVPYRPLVADQSKGIGPADLAGNLVIHGDNLHALKALLPRYAGQVDLVFIDPPYNTGNEGWTYNDNVNSPIMKEWLSTNPVDAEDMLRHDKWLCMMWPRLVLLRELLSERGSIWITLDDNEVHRARMMLDEIFGEQNFVAHFIWKKMDSPSRNEVSRAISPYHDHLLCVAKDSLSASFSPEVRESIRDAYPLTLPDGSRARRRQLRKNGSNARRVDRPTLWYPLLAPDGTEVLPVAPEGWEGRWVLREQEWGDRTERGLTEWIKRDYGWVPYYIEVAPDEATAPWSTIWDDVDQNRQAKASLTEIFGRELEFQTPKPVNLVERVIHIASSREAMILDSFAGSGTTAHAVLKANAKDQGNRKFILVEGEDYADRLTAERVRRAIKGYAWVGTTRETLLEEKISWTQFKKAGEWLAKVEAVKAKEGFAEGDLADQGAVRQKRFDKINVELKDGVLRVEGEKRVSERAEGLGGEFTYCTLGEPLDIDKLLSGESLPDFNALGAWLFHTATGGTLPPAPKGAPAWYLGEAKDAHVWLVYEPSLSFLKSPDAALTLSVAKRFSEWGKTRADLKRHLVFAPAKYLSNKQLLEHGIDFAPLPFALYREG